MLVNLSIYINDFLSYKKNNPNQKTENLVDLPGVIHENDGRYHKIDLKTLDTDNKIKEKSITEYIEYCSVLSKRVINDKGVRSFKLLQFPVYWLSDISEKHPYYQPLLNIIYLKNLIVSEKLKSEKSEIVRLIISANSIHYLESIENYFKKYNIKTDVFTAGTKAIYTNRDFLSFLSQRRKEFLKIRAMVRKKKSERFSGNGNLVFTTVPGTWIPETRKDYIMNEIFELTLNRNVKIKYLPLFTSFSSIMEWNGDWVREYKDAFPSYLSFHFLCVKMWWLYRKIDNVISKKIQDELISDNGILLEMQKSMYDKFYLFFNYLWYINFFKKLKSPTSIFYQDELYHPGRIISKAVEVSGNINLKTFGVQHGIIMPGHTVYKISDAEISDHDKEDALPIPQNLLVWGKYFQNLFSCSAAKFRSIIEVAGNPKYILAKKRYSETQLRKEKVKLLWCTGLMRDVAIEYQFMEELLLTNSNYEMVIRCHPVHNIKTDLKKIMARSIFQRVKFSTEPELVKDIKDNEIIITCSASTVYLDALVMNKKVLSIDTGNYILDKVSVKGLYNINSKEEFHDQFFRAVSYDSDNTTGLGLDEYLHVGDEVWNKILI
jgi:hypothetical protein